MLRGVQGSLLTWLRWPEMSGEEEGMVMSLMAGMVLL
jgi:hypothetical protein